MARVKSSHYPPPRSRGLAFQLGAGFFLTTVAALATWQAFESDVGIRLTLYILLAALAAFPLPFLAYWGWSLLTGGYTLSRDSLRLRWGLRVEEIPLSDVEWVRAAGDLATPLDFPWIRLPGAVLGFRRHTDLGMVEYMAAQPRDLLLVATAKRTFAISPEEPATFVQEFARAVELGSLSPAPKTSIYPTFIVVEAWGNPLARYLWLAGLLLNIGLLAWTSLQAPGLGNISLGYAPDGSPLAPSPGVQIIILPLVSILFFLTGWLAGLFFYRRPNEQTLAFIIWGSGTLTSVLFLISTLFILTTPA
ncbi:MAG: hypothetical protein FJZ96_08275 [Chloroflexi bacterium]|nr:hypothetical protein [Chloroflexota bacterium]